MICIQLGGLMTHAAKPRTCLMSHRFSACRSQPEFVQHETGVEIPGQDEVSEEALHHSLPGLPHHLPALPQPLH